MSIYFVEPTTTRLDLGQDDDGQPMWIEVKTELNYGEQQELAGLALRLQKTDLGSDAAPSVEMDWAAYGLAKLKTWIVDWSFTDAQGKPVKVSRESVQRLRPWLAQACEKAIDEHAKSLETAKN